MNLNGKRVLITGAARRLGREVAIHLSKAGCLVTAHYNHSRAEAESLKAETGCSLLQADFNSVTWEVLGKRMKELGDIDILINNASSFRKASWSEVDESLWEDEINVNLKTPFFLCQHFGKGMKQRGSGKIINMVDVAARHPYLSYLPYSVAKAGVIALTEALARALAPEVQVNAIAPGTILYMDGMTEEAKQKLVDRIPAKRIGTMDEFLKTVDFLLSDVDYITGQTIVLDGGRSLSW
jgi:pteridine reductase